MVNEQSDSLAWSSVDPPFLGPKLRLQRDRVGKTIATLSETSGIASSAISNFETGKRLPSVTQLLILARELCMDPFRLMLARTLEETQREIPTDVEGELLALRQQVLDHLRDSAEADSLPHQVNTTVHGDRLTLREWHEAFNIRTVIVGDRREDPPNTVADILALTASTGDLTYFPDLNLSNARIRSDKILKLAQPADLRKKLDHDILVVGSPAANLAGRFLNDQACFRFYISPDVRESEREFEADVSRFAFDPDELKAFAKRKNSHLTRLKENFARPGFIDPIDFEGPRGFTQGRGGSRSDFGIVTICNNPWSESGVAVLAAGISGPGTAASLKLLANPNAFDNHPFGGVFRINVATEAHWEDRYDILKPVWDTHDYTVEKFEDDAKKMPEMRFEGSLTDDEVKRLQELMELLQRRVERLKLMAAT